MRSASASIPCLTHVVSRVEVGCHKVAVWQLEQQRGRQAQLAIAERGVPADRERQKDTCTPMQRDRSQVAVMPNTSVTKAAVAGG